MIGGDYTMLNEKKILILTGSFGNGHLSVTNSIVNEFNRMNLNNVSVIEHDLFLEAHPITTSLLKKWYINSYKYFRRSYKMFYYSNPEKVDQCFYKYYGLNRLVNLLIKEKPDLIVLTFPTPVISVLTKNMNMNIPVVTVLTDYTIHKNWITPNSNKYYVATQHTKQQLVNLNIPSEMVQVTGIPIHETFEHSTDRAAWLLEHGLSPSKKTLLMVAGAFGVVEGLDAMLSTINDTIDAQFVVVTGNNAKLNQRLTHTYQDYENILIIGFTHHMSEWMSSCDLMITKPGGITISESLSQSIPLLFFNPAPGQEGENAVYFEQQGYARITKTMRETADLAVELLTDIDQLSAMKMRMQQDYIPASSEKICTDIINQLDASKMKQTIQSKVDFYAKFFAR